MTIDFHKRPNVIPWPPLIYLLTTIVAFVLHTLVPWHVFADSAGWWPGLAIATCGIILDFSAMFVMLRAATNILPHLAAGRLVTWGPFAWTRNPIYLGNTVGLLGFGLAFSGWFLGAAAVAALAVDRLAIRREEEHLHRLFGEEWTNYACRVPRWIGLSGHPNA
jgi:protein-S-isoprenylcysteine O-methyltransferase Ste14